jgi:hypothetical protein
VGAYAVFRVRIECDGELGGKIVQVECHSLKLRTDLLTAFYAISAEEYKLQSNFPQSPALFSF